MIIRAEKIAVIPIPSFLIPNVPVGSAECRLIRYPDGLTTVAAEPVRRGGGTAMVLMDALEGGLK